MKKYINIAFYYAIFALASGVFFREFTKINGFTGKTTLSLIHTHSFLLGMVMFLLITALSKSFNFEGNKKFKFFFITYNIGVPITIIMLFVRGITQVLNLTLSKGANASISGMAGIGHILTGIGIILFFMSLKELADK